MTCVESESGSMTSLIFNKCSDLKAMSQTCVETSNKEFMYEDTFIKYAQ